ncbi:hypothetical protein C2869_10685 [Saccharobesus litoralis]|uniref:Chaperone NapD n=1 Tax=Saccharobesus litoralis TaxID=2172099 RepID=A0A2S0VRZ0_9ALTE|nr:chaperone NapD [Saccharobesus litoralis]AWB66870.1 hypothetical protein C2869_10685 [Saccharobesus litoralis]
MSAVQEASQPEYHVASFVAQAIPAQIQKVQNSILSQAGSEIHAVSDEGKIVFTIEADSQNRIGKTIDDIKQDSAILTLAPVYHQFLTEQV